MCLIPQPCLLSFTLCALNLPADVLLSPEHIPFSYSAIHVQVG